MCKAIRQGKLYVNPDGANWERERHVFHFGAYGTVHVLSWGHVEDALERACETLRDVAPGLFHEPDYSALDGLREDSPEWQAALEEAEQDLTYTESGWLASWEWTVMPEPCRAYLLSLRGD